MFLPSSACFGRIKDEFRGLNKRERLFCFCLFSVSSLEVWSNGYQSKASISTTVTYTIDPNSFGYHWKVTSELIIKLLISLRQQSIEIFLVIWTELQSLKLPILNQILHKHLFGFRINRSSFKLPVNLPVLSKFHNAL